MQTHAKGFCLNANTCKRVAALQQVAARKLLHLQQMQQLEKFMQMQQLAKVHVFFVFLMRVAH